MSKLFREHSTSLIEDPIEGKWISDILFLNRKETKCARFFQESGNHFLECSYYVGADWFPHREKEWFYVESKLNKKIDPNSGEELGPEPSDLVEVDVIKMLFDALQEPEVREHTNELFEIKFESEWIPLNRKQDLISPLIMIQFLNLVKDIVRKGLKKSYYRVEENLYAKVKGKVLIGQTIKQNLVKNKNLNTVCQYEQFGVNGIENRVLKKTLVYIKRYLSTYKGLSHASFFQESFNYIQPAFLDVSEEVSLNDIKHLKFNPFYKNYEKAIELAKLILQRFSYNLNSIQDQETILTPPFWIDMSKLFELYVLGKLKKNYGTKITYHPRTYGNELDFLYHDGNNSIIIDSKYKPQYIGKSHQGLHQDIRQVSGYSRLKSIRKKAGVTDTHKLLNCAIVFPEITKPTDEVNLFHTEVEQYEKVWKVGVGLPLHFDKNQY
ncbi:McrC family protein [Algoriphagus marincola]|uniref:McrC family protein n=1 Tax=Algoriphagus marincola TaxID=264027 RepID=A0ABS7N3H4_9BACT|nr:McrC family protein [Algoriphagus marincola]MBY5950541.1 McrC family protein [Algoriphagus marincola]